MERKSEILQNTIIKNGLLQCWENGEETVCVPEGVTTIGKCCFRGMTSIKKVIFPESLRTIGEYSFDGCSNLETLVFSSGLKRIGNACFRNCVSLESIILHDSLVSMHAEAFENCLRLSGLSLPDSLKNNIESHTFSGCLSLRSINLPAGVRQVKKGAFAGCAALESVDFQNEEILIDATSFSGCVSLNKQAQDFINAHLYSDDTVDINSRATGAPGRLSNFTERYFEFEGVECHSIEGVLQSLKCPDAAKQREICALTGGWAKLAGSQYDWKTDQKLYWQGTVYFRSSEAYADLLDRIFNAVFAQDAAFRADLAAIRGKKIDHRMGLTNRTETVLTRMEFIKQLERLSALTAF